MRSAHGEVRAAHRCCAWGAAAAAHDHGVPTSIRWRRCTSSPNADLEAALRDVSGQVLPRRDALGRQLVLASMREHQLEDLSRHVHEVERRCGGYFAFATRAEAEAFVASDTALRGLGAALPAYTIQHQAMVNRWLPQVSEPALRATIQHLSTAWPNRYFNSIHGHAAPVWIRDHWLSLAAGRSDVTPSCSPPATTAGPALVISPPCQRPRRRVVCWVSTWTPSPAPDPAMP